MHLTTCYIKSSGIILFITMMLCFIPLFSFAQYQPIQEIILPDEEAALVADITQDGKKLAVGTGSTTQVWDLESGKMTSIFNDLSYIQCVSFSKDGNYLLSSGQKLTTSLYNMKTNQIVYRFRSSANPPHGSVWPMSQGYFSSDEKFIYTQGYGVFQIWDFSTGNELYSSDKIKQDFFVTNKIGQILLRNDRKVELFDLETSQIIKSYEGTFVAFSGNKKVLLLASDTQYIYIDIEKNEEIRRMPRDFMVFGAYDLSYTGNMLIYGNYENGMNRKIFFTDSTKAVREYPYNANEKMGPTSEDFCLKIFPDGKKFISANGTSIYIWDISDLTTAVKDAGKF